MSKTMRPAATRTAGVFARARMQWADRARHRGAKSLLGKSHTHLLLLMAMTLSHHRLAVDADAMMCCKILE